MGVKMIQVENPCDHSDRNHEKNAYCWKSNIGRQSRWRYVGFLSKSRLFAWSWLIYFSNCAICRHYTWNDQFLLHKVIDPLAKTVYDL